MSHFFVPDITRMPTRYQFYDNPQPCVLFFQHFSRAYFILHASALDDAHAFAIDQRGRAMRGGSASPSRETLRQAYADTRAAADYIRGCHDFLILMPLGHTFTRDRARGAMSPSRLATASSCGLLPCAE